MIPDAAVEAALGSYVGGNEMSGPDIAGDFLTREQLRTILEAAAPHIAAAAWEEGYLSRAGERYRDLFNREAEPARNPYRKPRG